MWAVGEGRTRQPIPVPGFPELADTAAVWSPLGEAPGESASEEMAHAAGTWQPRLPCRNPACLGGGFDLASVVEGMLSYREAEKAGILVCEGWEAPPAGQAAAGVPCVRAIQYRLRLTYRSAGPHGPAERPGPPPPSRPLEGGA